MSTLLAVTAAFGWGLADFFVRFASDRLGSRSTVYYSQALSAVLLLPVLAATWSTDGADLRLVNWLFAIGSGVLNAVGLTLVYEAIRRGPMSLVCPIASSFGAVAAILAIAVGERPSSGQLAGIATLAFGIVVANIPATGGRRPTPGARGAWLATAASLLWGAGFVLLTPAFEALGPVLPILFTRFFAVAGNRVAAAHAREPIKPLGNAWRLIVAISVFDTGAFLCYAAAVDGSMTSVASVLASLFSVVTIVLAGLLLRERLSRMQWLGVILVLLGVAIAAA